MTLYSFILLVVSFLLLGPVASFLLFLLVDNMRKHYKHMSHRSLGRLDLVTLRLLKVNDGEMHIISYG